MGKATDNIIGQVFWAGLGTAFWVVVAWMMIINIQDLYAWYMEPTDYDAACRAETIEWSGYRACWIDPSCNLSDKEASRMYRSSKKAIISCDRSIATKLFIGNIMPAPGLHEQHGDFSAGNK